MASCTCPRWSQHRVAKASDVVKEGDKVQVWIKELDRDKNRISLTMVAPGTMTLRDLEEGKVVTGRITRLERYGAFVDIGVGRDGMLHVKEMAHGYVEKPEDLVKVGDEIEVQIVGLDQRRGRIDLSRKGLLPPPERRRAAVAASGLRRRRRKACEPWSKKMFLSPFELAFQEANQGNERRGNDRRKKTRRGMSTRKRKTSSSARSPITRRARASKLPGEPFERRRCGAIVAHTVFSRLQTSRRLPK